MVDVGTPKEKALPIAGNGGKSTKIKFLLYPLVRLPARSDRKHERSDPLRNLDEFALSGRSTSPRRAEFHANGFLKNT